MPGNLYQILRVKTDCSFDELRKAYRQMAKQCHPDLFGNSPEKTAEFQLLVNAFDILSDAESRREYDKRLALMEAPPEPLHYRAEAIMDTIADDILEELVVGNDLPPGATLQSLMLDLARTERFIMFRQAKDFFIHGGFRQCYHLCSKLVELSPDNILYHFYLAESSRKMEHFSKAARHYGICLQIGVCRNPPQRLLKIRRRYHEASAQKGFWGKLIDLFREKEEIPQFSEEDKLRMALEKTFARDEQRQNHSSKRHQKSEHLLR